MKLHGRGLNRLADIAVIGGGTLIALLITVAALRRLGETGLLVPLAVGAGIVLLRWPAAILFGTIALVVLAEGPDFGLLGASSQLYRDIVKGVSPVDLLFAYGFVALGLQLLREQRALRLPPMPLTFASAMVLLALASGVLVGRANGVGLSEGLLATHTFMYLVLLPLAIVNLRLDARRLRWLIGATAALAIVKAVLGLAVVATGRGTAVVGESALTYYAPTGNWIVMIALLGVVAALLLRARPPLWLLLAAPLLAGSLLLSYRRSFWIGATLGLAVVVVCGMRPLGRRLLLPIAVLLAIAIGSLGSIAVQSDTPLGQRLESLSSSRIDANKEDRYRIDERTNVLAEIRAAPVSGLGLQVPWSARAVSLPVESNPDHLYVHFAALYWWLKLGIVGVFAYAALITAGLLLSLRVFRRSRERLFRAFGLASLAGIVGLIAIESTATFSGVDFRFTIIYAAQLGLLALLSRLPGEPSLAAARPAAAPGP